jgi:hypothetical protein
MTTRYYSTRHVLPFMRRHHPVLIIANSSSTRLHRPCASLQPQVRKIAIPSVPMPLLYAHWPLRADLGQANARLPLMASSQPAFERRRIRSAMSSAALPYSHSATRSVFSLRPAGTSRLCFSGSFHKKSPAQTARGFGPKRARFLAATFPKSATRPWEQGTLASRCAGVSRVRFGQFRFGGKENGTLRKQHPA